VSLDKSDDSLLSSPEEEAIRIINRAEKDGIRLRLLGGIAIKLRCKSAAHRTLTRSYADIDMVGSSKQRKGIKALFPELGYSPREVFNRLHPERLIFHDLEHRRRVDIFLDYMQMCHRLDFRNRLGLHPYTIPLADLLMTKLQVVEMTEREIKDVLAMLMDHPIGETDDSETINGRYIAQICADDWGIFKTFTVNLVNIGRFLSEYLPSPEDAGKVKERLDTLHRMIMDAPKTSRWKIRAVIGEKKKWYELPETDKPIVESAFPGNERNSPSQ
jgi:hypothetical protein